MEQTSAAGPAPEGTIDVHAPPGTAIEPAGADLAGVPAAEIATAVPPAAPPSRWTVRRLLRLLRPHIAAILMATVVVIVCRYNQHPGHDFGDDFSLYIRQAKAITNGGISKVISQNEFTVTKSSWHSFSPSIYPWGFPIMLAPLYWIGGIDYSLFKLFEAILFGGFLLFLYGVVNKRIGRLGGFVVMATIGVSVAYVGWTDTVLSDIPYLFVGFLSLWLLDRVRLRGGFEGDRLWPLIAVGVAVGYAYSTRREGSALLAGVLAAQAAWVINRWLHRDTGQRFSVRWSRLATPLLSFIGFVGLLRIILPAPFLEHYDHTGIGQIRANLKAYGASLAEQIGLKDPGRAFPGGSLWGFAGSAGVAKVMFGVFLALAAAGIIVRLVIAFAEDIALFTYLVGTTFIIGVAPFRDSRYIFSLTPLLVYFAFQGIATVPDTLRRVLPNPARSKRFVTVPLATAAIALLVVANGTDTWHKTKFRYDNGSYTLQGAAQPTWQELFTEVRLATKPTDVVAFFRSRTMVLYTERNSIQSTSIDGVIDTADYYARRKDASNYSQAPLDSQMALELGFTLVWQNTEFELWQVPKS